MKKTLFIAASAALIMAGAGTAVAGSAIGKCKACHTLDQGGANKTGPNLFGIMGAKSGSVAGFKYGDFLAGGAIEWTEENMRAWLEDSKGMAKAAGKGTSMPKQGMKGAKLDAAIEELKALK